MWRGLWLRIVGPYSLLFAALTGASGWYAAQQVARISEQRLVSRMRSAGELLARVPLYRTRELERVKSVLDLEVAVIDLEGSLRHTLRASAGPELRRLLLAGRDAEGTVELGGQPYRYVRGIGDGPVTAARALLVPEARIGAARREAVRGIITVAAAAVLAAILLGSWLARGVSRPLAVLAAEAGRIAEGDLERRVEPRGPAELQALADSFNRMVEGLARSRARLIEAESQALLGRVATTVAHEIRNPLTSIRMAVELRAEAAPPDEGEELAMLLAEIERLEVVAGELLTLGRPGALERRPIDLRRPVDDVVRLLGPRFAHRKVTLEHERPPDAVTVEADGDRIKQALMNLAINALEASPAGSRVRLTIDRDAGDVRITVADEGPGVADPERLFTPYYTTKPGGTGIGLTLCRQIAEAHGGRLTLVPSATGARFELRLR